MLTQVELIGLYHRFKADAGASPLDTRDRYEHLLLSLRRIIESHGPTRDYTGFLYDIAEPAPEEVVE